MRIAFLGAFAARRLSSPRNGWCLLSALARPDGNWGSTPYLAQRFWVHGESIAESSRETELQDIFHEFPQFDSLTVHLTLSKPNSGSPSGSHLDFSPLPPTEDSPEKDVSIPSPLCGVPLLEDLFRKNRDHPALQNTFLMRILTHESVLYRGVMERKRRVSRLSKYMDRKRRLETENINRPWILDLARLLCHPEFRFAPEQFQSFQLTSGKRVKLAVPSPRDEIVLDSLRLVLDAILEPRFSDFSFGFRPGKGRQIALRNLRNHIRGMDYYIVADLSAPLQQLRGFEMVQAVCAYLQDPIFERLMYKALDVGYINTYGLEVESFVSVPKEMGISPVLVNCYLDAFDKWLGLYRNAYSDFKKPLKWPLTTDFTPAAERQLRFVRCGPSLFIGMRGNRSEVYAVMGDIRTKLKAMKLDTSILKIRAHHASDHRTVQDRAFFLGYEIGREQLPEDMPASLTEISRLQTRPLLHIPTLALRECFLENGFVKLSKRKTWIPFGNGNITHWPVEHIVRYFDRLTVGLLEFYALADNFQQLNWFVYLLKRSCNLTVGRKLQLRSMQKVFVKYGRDLEVKDGDTVVATLPDRSLTVRPLVQDFYPDLTPYLRRRRFITRGSKQNSTSLDND